MAMTNPCRDWFAGLRSRFLGSGCTRCRVLATEHGRTRVVESRLEEFIACRKCDFGGGTTTCLLRIAQL